MEVDEVSEKALQAVRAEDPRKAREILEELISQNPDKIDLRHSLAVILLNMGEAHAAHIVCEDAIRMCYEQQSDTAATMMTPILLANAEAFEGMYQPRKAEEQYKKILETEEGHPYAQQRYAYLLFSWGKIDDGLKIMQSYVDGGYDDPEAITAHENLIATIRTYLRNDVHPKEFLQAHRDAYVAEFNTFAEKLESEGWYLEPARMKKNPNGDGFVLIIAEDGPSYAATRVDAYNPETGQPGRIGEGPYIVGLADYAIMAQSPFVDAWPGKEFPVFVSSRCPWNNLSIQIRVVNENSLEVLDSYIGDWYEAGFHGAFGIPDKEGMFHEIYAEKVDTHTAAFYVDCGRARFDAVNDLLNRLETMHGQYFIDAVLFGEGKL